MKSVTYTPQSFDVVTADLYLADFVFYCAHRTELLYCAHRTELIITRKFSPKYAILKHA